MLAAVVVFLAGCAADGAPDLDALTAEVVDTSTLEALGEPLALSPDGDYVFAEHPANDEVCAFAVASDKDDICVPWQGPLGMQPEWSPDGDLVAFTESWIRNLLDGDVWVFEPATRRLVNLTDDGFTGETSLDVPPDHLPFWGPDGSLVFYLTLARTSAGPVLRLMTVDPDGAKPPEVAHDFGTTFPSIIAPMRWIDDGVLAFASEFPTDHPQGLFDLDLEGGRTSLVLAPDPERGVAHVAAVSPDGRYATVYYRSYATAGRGRPLQPIAELLDLPTGTLRRLLPEAGPDDALGPLAVAMSQDGSKVAIAWNDFGRMQDVGGFEAPTPTLSVMDLGSGEVTGAFRSRDLLRFEGSANLAEHFVDAPGSPVTPVTVWNEEDELFLRRFADPPQLVVVRVAEP